jgi:DNA-binding NtrC family response regulator
LNFGHHSPKHRQILKENLTMAILDLNEQKVLVVDDEQPICDLLRLALTRAGYSVFTASSSQHAFEVMHKEICQAMFIDLYLPETDGIDLYKVIKSEYPNSIAYLMTGWASEEDLFACHAAGFKSCLFKPVSLSVFLRVVQEAFAQIDDDRLKA